MANELNKWIAATSGAWDTAGNWSIAVPIADQIVVIPRSATYAIVGSDQTGTDLNGFSWEEYSTVALGTEILPLKIKVSAGVINLGGSAESTLQVVGHVTDTTINVYGTPNLHLCHFVSALGVVGAVAVAKSINIDADGGAVWIGWGDNDVVKVDDIYARGPVSVKVGKGTLRADGGGPISTLVLDSTGDSECRCAAVAVTCGGGTLHFIGATITTLTVSGGILRPSGTVITTANVFGDGILDLEWASTTVEITTLNLYEGGTLNDPHGMLKAGCIINHYGGTLDIKKPIKLTTAAL